jgi:hypothetical protein
MPVRKPNIGARIGTALNPLTFNAAYNHVANNPAQQYRTLSGVPFTAIAAITTKGEHRGLPVLRFMSEGRERARAYAECWGCQTNCNRTHIDIYTAQIQ